jgi:hypothetical protein
MGNDPLSYDIDGVTPLIEAARTAALTGDTVAAEEALVDAYDRISKILKNMDERGPRSLFAVRPSVALWRGVGV